MSVTTDLRDKIKAAVAELYPNKSLIPYPLNLEDNNELFLRDGYCIRVGSSSARTATDNPQYTIDTDFEVVLTTRVSSTMSDADPFQAEESALLNERDAIVNDFTNTERFRKIDLVEFINISSLSGTEEAIAGKYKHITTSAVFTITHWSEA